MVVGNLWYLHIQSTRWLHIIYWITFENFWKLYDSKIAYDVFLIIIIFVCDKYLESREIQKDCLGPVLSDCNMAIIIAAYNNDLNI